MRIPKFNAFDTFHESVSFRSNDDPFHGLHCSVHSLYFHSPRLLQSSESVDSAPNALCNSAADCCERNSFGSPHEPGTASREYVGVPMVSINAVHDAHSDAVHFGSYSAAFSVAQH